MAPTPSPPARLAAQLLFGCDAPALVQQRMLPLAHAVLDEAVRQSVQGGYAPWPTSAPLSSADFARQLAAMFRMLAPPVRADLRIESQLVHLVRREDPHGFSLCFPVCRLSREQRMALDELLDAPETHFERVARVAQDFTLPYGEVPPPRCAGCKRNDEVEAVLGRADLLARAAWALRATLRSDDPGDRDGWRAFRAVLERVAQDPLLRDVPAFAEFYDSAVASWAELRARPLVDRCWRVAAAARAGHPTGRGQRRLAAELWALSGATTPLADPEDAPADAAVVRGLQVAALLRDPAAVLGPEAANDVETKAFFLGLEVFFKGAGRDTLARLFQSRREGQGFACAAARALMPFLWPPALEARLRPGAVAPEDNPAARRAARAVADAAFVASELAAETPGVLDLSLCHWYALWKAGCAGLPLNAPTEAGRRQFAPALRRVHGLGAGPADPAARAAVDRVGKTAADLALAVAEGAPGEAPLAPRFARTWGTLDALARLAADRTHYFEANALGRSMSRRAPDAVVLRVLDDSPGAILDAEHTAARFWDGFADAAAVEGVTYVMGSRTALEREAALAFARAGAVREPGAADVLAWCFAAGETAAANSLLAARYGVSAEAAAALDEAAALPYLPVEPTGAPLDFALPVPEAARARAALLLQVQPPGGASMLALDVLPLPLRAHPLGHLCDGTARHAAAPLWSARPDLLRIVWLALYP